MSTVLNSEHEYRGYLINEFTILERSLDKHLLFHFFPNDNANSPSHWRMHEVVLDRMTFDGKRTAAKGILDNKCISAGFIKTKNNSFPHGKVFEEVRRLIEIRNQFAHYLLVMDNVNKKNVISLLSFRDTTGVISYTQEEFDAVVQRINNAKTEILKLLPERTIL